MSKPSTPIIPDSPQKIYVERENAVQTSIWIGKSCPYKGDDDFHGLQILNTIFGGYFGSRLMKNIREDKGYTYGIGSALIPLIAGGYFVILTETGKDVCKDAVKEIFYEMQRLQNDKVSEQELILVKNFLQGEVLRMFDGPFAISESFQSVLEFGLDIDYYKEYLKTIENINADQLLTLAQKYFNINSFHEVLVG